MINCPLLVLEKQRFSNPNVSPPFKDSLTYCENLAISHSQKIALDFNKLSPTIKNEFCRFGKKLQTYEKQNSTNW